MLIVYKDGSEFKLEYDEAKHSYVVDDNKIPSVTKVIDSCFPKYLVDWAVQESASFFMQSVEPYRRVDPATFMIPFSVIEHIHEGILTASKTISEHAADVGSVVHDWISRGIQYKMGNKELPDMPSDDEAINCVEAFKEWTKGKEINWISTEQKIYCHSDIVAERFAGTVDAVAEINGKEYVIDFKTSKKIYKPYHLQVAAYAKAVSRMYETKPWGLILRLDKETGKFQEKVFDPEPHYQAFNMCLHLRKWSSERIKSEFSLDIQGQDGR